MQAVVEIARLRMSQGLGFRVLIAAPTHSAKNTLIDKLPKEVLGWVQQSCSAGLPSEVYFTTVASAFSFRLQTDVESGDYYLSRSNCYPKIFRAWDLIIIDEVSLLNRKACEILRYGIKGSRIKTILLMGDHYQLSPVKEKMSVAFTLTPDIERLELTEQMRCQGPIETVVAKSKGQVYLPTLKDADDDHIYLHSTREDLISSACETFSNAHRDGVDYSQWAYLTYANWDVEECAHRIRQAIYGKRVADYAVGEWLRVKNGVKIADNSDLVDILRVVQRNILGYGCWGLEIHNPLRDESEIVTVIAKESQKRFSDDVKDLQAKGDLCKAQGDLSGAQEYWSRRTQLQESFATLQYSVAMSVHWSQGCTFQKCWVDNDRLSKSSNKAQLLYVAYSRAARELHVRAVHVAVTKPQLIALFLEKGFTPESARDHVIAAGGPKMVRPKTLRTMTAVAQWLSIL
jgi:hypothetical protein